MRFVRESDDDGYARSNVNYGNDTAFTEGDYMQQRTILTFERKKIRAGGGGGGECSSSSSRGNPTRGIKRAPIFKIYSITSNQGAG